MGEDIGTVGYKTHFWDKWAICLTKHIFETNGQFAKNSWVFILFSADCRGGMWGRAEPPTGGGGCDPTCPPLVSPLASGDHNVKSNPRPTKGGYHSPDGLSPAAKNAKESDTGHLGHLFYILHVLCGHFEPSKLEGRGVVATSKYFKSPFWKISAWYFFGLFSLKMRFLSPAMFGNVIVTSYTLTDFHEFGINGKRRPYLIPWYQTIILWARQFQVHKGGGNQPPW